MPRSNQFIPQARSHGLVITDLDGEILIYDKDRDKAHCLNQTAALVWKYSNGTRTIAEIAQRMAKELASPLETPIVWFALQQLEKDHLLKEDITVGASRRFAPEGITRREFVKQMGKAAVVVAVPIIISITAPSPAAAGNCLANGQVMQ